MVTLTLFVKGRLDGAVCEYTEEEKMAYLHRCAQKVKTALIQTFPGQGVTNMEMEALVFAALTHKVPILLFFFKS